MSTAQYAWDNPGWHQLPSYLDRVLLPNSYIPQHYIPQHYAPYPLDDDIWLPSPAPYHVDEDSWLPKEPCSHTRLTLKGPCPRCGARFDADGKQLP